jgi:hypothetical protein
MAIAKWWHRHMASRVVTMTPRPVLESHHRIVTLGSCFAAEIRRALQDRGFSVLPRIDPAVLDLFSEQCREIPSWGVWDERAHLEWYNTFTIRQEFEKAFGLWHQADDDFWSVRQRLDGQERVVYQDPYRRRVIADTPEAVRTITRELDRGMRAAIHEAELVVITLGLIEVWRKFDNGRFAGCEPGYCHGGGQDETYFHLSTFEDNLANLRALLDLFFGAYPERHVVLTVSPVALGRTFRDVDVYVANMESKSLLRAVAGQIAREYPNVVYFPSYEMATLDPHTFEEDGRHVRPEKVDEIVSAFVANHVVGAAPAAPARRVRRTADGTAGAAEAAGAQAAHQAAAPAAPGVPSAALLYLLGKLVASPAADARNLLDALNIDDLRARLPDYDRERFEAVRALPADQIAQFAAQVFRSAAARVDALDFPAAIREGELALALFLELMERGNLAEAVALSDFLLGTSAAASPWSAADLTKALAGAVVAAGTGERPMFAHLAHINLYGQSNGVFPQLLGWFLQQRRPARPLADLSGVLRLERPGRLQAILGQMRADGYCAVPESVPAELVESLHAFAKEAPGTAYPAGVAPRGPLSLAEAPAGTEGIYLPEQDVIDRPEVQRLLRDPSFLTVAQGYLGCQPILESVRIWWSLPTGHVSGELAQLFHMDPDLNRTVHFFVYLTDVDATAGPHAYVRGSHRPKAKPPAFVSTLRRIGDDEIAAAYGEGSVVEAVGGRGTVLCGDTKAWHKGVAPTARPRLMLQLLFADTLLLSKDNGRSRIRRDHDPDFLAFVDEHPEVFANFIRE